MRRIGEMSLTLEKAQAGGVNKYNKDDTPHNADNHPGKLEALAAAGISTQDASDKKPVRSPDLVLTARFHRRPRFIRLEVAS
jgi:hypothetical protein